MTDKKFVGTFQSEDQVLNKIDKLREQGYAENQIYVVTDDVDSLTNALGQTHVNLRDPEGSWLDQFRSFLAGDEPTRGAFKLMGFTKGEALRYYNDVNDGYILLFVDNENNIRFNHQEVGIQDSYVDPNLGSNLIVNDYNNTFPNQDRLNVDDVPPKLLNVNEEKIVEPAELHEHELLDEDLYLNRNRF